MERVALDAGAGDRGIQEAEVEAAVVADQHRALAAAALQRLAHALEDLAERLLLAHRHAQRVAELDAGEVQRRLFDVGALERLDAEERGVLGIEQAVVVHGDGGRGDLQQGVGGAVEAAGLDVHHHRQEAAEAARHRRLEAAGVGFLFVVFVVDLLAHASFSSTRQCSFSPARSGTSWWSPKCSSVGATQSSRIRVMVSVLRGRP
ncbi:hypothetical protein D3C81_1569620 [compost metagenome]